VDEYSWEMTGLKIVAASVYIAWLHVWYQGLVRSCTDASEIACQAQFEQSRASQLREIENLLEFALIMLDISHQKVIRSFIY
jgi:hypothetical protein